MLRGLERPPWWATVFIVVGLIGCAVLFPIAFDRGGLSSAQVERLNAALPEPTQEVEQPTVAFLGDSYVNGHTGVPATQTFAAQAADDLGWRFLAFGAGGTGYVKSSANGTPTPTYVDEVADASPDLVVVEGGINEYDVLPADITEGAIATLSALRAELPDVPIVVVGPFTPVTPVERGGLRTRDAVKEAVDQVGEVVFIDPIAEGWLSDQALIAEDGIHLTEQGAQEYADRFTQAVRSLEVAPAVS